MYNVKIDVVWLHSYHFVVVGETKRNIFVLNYHHFLQSGNYLKIYSLHKIVCQPMVGCTYNSFERYIWIL